MTSKKQLIVTLALSLCFSAIYAQEDTTESVVVLSENDITSLISTLKKYKKEKEVNSNYNIELDSIKPEATKKLVYQKNQIEVTKNQQPLKEKNNSNPNNALLERRLNTLDYEISQLNYIIKQLAASNNNVVSSALPQNETTRIIEVPKTVYIKENITSINNEDDRLQRQLDSLYVAFKNIKQPTNVNYVGDFKAIQERIDELKKSMQDKKSEPSNYDVLSKKYKGYNKTIFFADNSKTLNLNASATIEELYSILDANENLDVIVKGFASNKGNAIYNENLSMQRTEAVKKGLMLRGVHPTRVLTQYHGIDYETSKEAEARRVEISILVRK